MGWRHWACGVFRAFWWYWHLCLTHSLTFFLVPFSFFVNFILGPIFCWHWAAPAVGPSICLANVCGQEDMWYAMVRYGRVWYGVVWPDWKCALVECPGPYMAQHICGLLIRSWARGDSKTLVNNLGPPGLVETMRVAQKSLHNQCQPAFVCIPTSTPGS